MNIQGYFWLVLIVLMAVVATLFGTGFTLGARSANKSAGIGVGIAILVILAVVFGGAKSQEARVGPLIVYEGAWLASAFNFALTGGFIAGKYRAARDAGKRAIPILCVAISLGSMFLMGSRLHQLVDVLQQLGVGEARAKPAGPDTSLNCKESLTKIYAGFQHYAEIDDALPAAGKWIDEEDLRSAVQADEWFHCPMVSNRKDDKYGYAYNDALAGRKLNGKKLAEIPDASKTPLVFDSSDLAKDAHDPLTTLPRPGRHGGRNNILYCDGHIETIAPK
jgi:prepilin-type processing-associated H-X9-DG protein